jgi:protein involved in polysaccharide export with SLBB domain
VPVVIGRDPREPAQVIGKNFLLRVWLSNVGGNGVQKIFSVRVGVDGNITVPGMAPIKAEGVAIATLEQQMSAALKASSPTASAWVTILDRSSPPPAPASQPAPATQPAAAAAATTKPATLPAK